MKVKFLGIRGSLRDVADSARTTVNKDAGEKDPSSNWKRRMLLCEHEFMATTQAMINISRKRLCNQASKETREAWQEVLNSIKDIETELYSVCVPDCVYRGWCYEFKSCGYHKTEDFKEKLEKYRTGIN